MNFKIICMLEAILLVVFIIILFILKAKRKSKIKSYLESVAYNTDSAKNHTLMNFPLPISVFRIDDSRIVWGNEYFFNIAGYKGSKLDAKISDIIPEFNSKWLTEGKTQFPSLLSVNGHKYRIHGNLIRPNDVDETSAYMGITYWFDVTDYDDIRIKYENTRPVICIIAMDNLDDLIKNQPDKIKNDIRELFDDKLISWVNSYNGIVRRYDRDRYLCFFEKQSLELMKKDEFTLIKNIKEIENPNGISLSISMGISDNASSLPEALKFADMAVELALTRGGDQAVVKNTLNYEFFGGRGDEVEKRTKVKSRVMANTLGGLIKDSSKVIVMGHLIADFDCIGAAVGICSLCRKYGVKSYIVSDEDIAAKALKNMLSSHHEYKNTFISPHEAMIQADGKTLLVIVDTNKPDQVIDIDLLESCNRVAIVDHHRVSANYVKNAVLGFIEPFASSTCELISEILEEKTEKGDILDFEADALLSGIVLDTKNFTIRTGERTFEAAAYLKKCGANTTHVKKLLQFNVNDTLAKFEILQTSVVYRNVVIAVSEVPHTRAVAAAAADDMLNISGVEASIVISKDFEGSVFASARSIGDLNVQIIMENLGGGGNKSAAAAQFTGVSLDEAKDKIYKAIDNYLGD